MEAWVIVMERDGEALVLHESGMALAELGSSVAGRRMGDVAMLFASRAEALAYIRSDVEPDEDVARVRPARVRVELSR